VEKVNARKVSYNMLCALIMAGGKGERFWPLSTDEKPKQFLNLLGEKTMIQMTVNRLNKFIPIERIFIVTAENYVNLVREQLPKIPKENIILEPIGRNTAPCIALSSFIIEKYYNNSTILVVPSDHLITNEEAFAENVNKAYNFIENNSDSIVTIGIKPDRPETGYGYIKLVNNEQIACDSEGICIVERFVEKPNSEKAKKYIEDGNYLWNSGMFVWKSKHILKLTEKYLKETYDILKEIAVSEEDYENKLKENYPNVENISVDYAIMENAHNIFVIPSTFGWDDIGTWKSVERYRERDANNNICVGSVNNISSNNNIIMGKGKPIVVVGLDDILIAETDEIIFIGKKENIENIKEIKNQIINRS
jgi:Mannose-1-phosphate guanylyltransferase